jgi:RNA polymerase sigma-70 factor (ECF subfamily)
MGKVVPLGRDPGSGPTSLALGERTDEELMRLVSLDTRAAFRALVVRHAERVASFCARISGDPAGASEIAQGVWLALWNARHRWEPRSAFASFLYAIAFSRARNHARSRRRSAAVFARQGIEEDIAVDPKPGEVERLFALELRARLQAAVDALPAPMRDAVVLRFVEELSYEEMEKMQNTRSSTLRSRVHHALARLREALREAP